MASKEIHTIELPPYEGGRGRSVIGLGETVYDIIFRDNQPQRAVPGGSAFNAIISLGRVLKRDDAPAAQVTMITETGDDHIGQLTRDFMEENGVDTSLVTVNKGTKSHISLAFLDQDNNAQYTFYKDHASAKLENSFTFSLFHSFTSEDIVVFGSFFAINPVIREHTRALLQAAHDAGAFLYYDINFRKSHIADIPAVIENLEENMRLATVVRGSAEDFGYLYGTTDAREVYDRHIRQHCPHFICTDGAGPIRLFSPAFYEAQIPTESLDNVVSTIGAGDNFNAGFVYALVRDGITPEKLTTWPVWLPLIKTGQRFSAHVCQRIENYVDIAFTPQCG